MLLCFLYFTHNDQNVGVFHLPYYNIADIVIKINSEEEEPFKRMGAYLDPSPRQESINFIFVTNDYIQEPKGKLISEEGKGVKWIIKEDSTGDKISIFSYKHGMQGGDIIAALDVAMDWKNPKITWAILKADSPEEMFFINYRLMHNTHLLMGLAFRYFLNTINGLVIHASVIKWQGQGIMFTAPSGTGKSTQVKLWQEYIDDVIILNDDNPAVRFIDDKPVVYGTPWCGSSHINTNDSAPLSAIIILEQAPQNKIRLLLVEEVLTRLMPRAFLPYFDNDLLNNGLNTLEKIIAAVPVYLLQCRPDKEAVELVYQCIV